MDNYEAFEVLKKQLCREIDQVAEQVQKNQSMSSQDLEKLDKMFHLKKSMLTCKAMEDAEEYEQGGYSGRRGRGANGRYVSRDMGNSQAYADGYSHGYSEAMNQINGGNSGHYPMAEWYPPRR